MPNSTSKHPPAMPHKGRERREQCSGAWQRYALAALQANGIGDPEVGREPDLVIVINRKKAEVEQFSMKRAHRYRIRNGRGSSVISPNQFGRLDASMLDSRAALKS